MSLLLTYRRRIGLLCSFFFENSGAVLLHSRLLLEVNFWGFTLIYPCPFTALGVGGSRTISAFLLLAARNCRHHTTTYRCWSCAFGGIPEGAAFIDLPSLPFQDQATESKSHTDPLRLPVATMAFQARPRKLSM